MDLVFESHLIITYFNSHITLTLDLSNDTICVSLFYCSTLIFFQMKYGMTFDDALESTKHLCTFVSKISKVIKRGGVRELDLFPINVVFTIQLASLPKAKTLPFSFDSVSGTLFSLFTVSTMTLYLPLSLGRPLTTLSSISHWWVILLNL